MDENHESLDLLDRRGRMVALVIAGVVGLACSLGILLAISTVGVHRNDDSLSRTMPALLGMGIFCVISPLVFRAVLAIRKRLRP